MKKLFFALLPILLFISCDKSKEPDVLTLEQKMIDTYWEFGWVYEGDTGYIHQFIFEKEKTLTGIYPTENKYIETSNWQTKSDSLFFSFRRYRIKSLEPDMDNYTDWNYFGKVTDNKFNGKAKSVRYSYAVPTDTVIDIAFGRKAVLPKQ